MLVISVSSCIDHTMPQIKEITKNMRPTSLSYQFRGFGYNRQNKAKAKAEHLHQFRPINYAVMESSKFENRK